MGRLVVGPDEPLSLPLTRVAVLQSWLAVADELKDGALVGAVPYSTVILHKRLLALLNAFGLGSPKQFARGEFVKAPFEGYSLAMAELRKKVHSGYESFLNVDGFVEHELRHLFAQLLRHRTFATRLLGAVSYDEAGTPSAGAVVRMTREANVRSWALCSTSTICYSS